VFEKGASTAFIVIDELVDGFVADGERAMETQGARDLFWAKVLFQQRDHLLPTVRGQVKAAAGAFASGGRIAVSQIRPVPPIDDLLVASNLAMDRTGGALQLSGNSCNGRVPIAELSNGVAFVLRELMISTQVWIPFLGGKVTRT